MGSCVPCHIPFVHSPLAGTEVKLADAVQVNTTKLCMELSLDILANQDSVCVPLEDIKNMIADSDSTNRQPVSSATSSSTRRHGKFELEDDKVLEIGAMVVRAQSQQPSVPHVPARTDRSEQPLDEDTRIERLFPNSFKITGFKHICDNALGSTLQAIPQYLVGQTDRLNSLSHVFSYET